MKVSAVISPKILKANTFRYDKISLMNFIVLALGLLFGSIIYILSEDYLTGEIWNYFIKFTTDFSTKSNIEILSGMILSHVPYVLLTVIFGTSAFGTGMVIIISIIKTMGLGLVGSYIYSSYGLKGIEYSIMVFFPGKFVLLFSMLLLMYISTTSSLTIRKTLIGEKQADYSLSEYLLKVSVGILFFILSSVIDFLATICFSSLFSFT